MTHPTRSLDEVVHQRHRLGILTIAAEARRVEFGYLREIARAHADNLSRLITVLAGAGLVEVEKGYEGDPDAFAPSRPDSAGAAALPPSRLRAPCWPEPAPGRPSDRRRQASVGTPRRAPPVGSGGTAGPYSRRRPRPTLDARQDQRR